MYRKFLSILLALCVASIPCAPPVRGAEATEPTSGSPLAQAREDYRVQSEKLRNAQAKIEELERRNKDQQKQVEDLNAKLNRQKNAEAAQTTATAKTPPAPAKKQPAAPGKKVVKQPPKPQQNAADKTTTKKQPKTIATQATARLLDRDYMEKASPEEVRELLAAGANVNARGRFGDTPLMMAARSNTPAVATALLSSGANVNARNDDGNTALMIAAKSNTPAVVTALLDAGADVNASNKAGRTALMIARRNTENATENAKVLLDAGADVNARDGDGYTALYLTVWFNRVDPAGMAKVLLDAGADVDARMQAMHVAGNTALMEAAGRMTREKAMRTGKSSPQYEPSVDAVLATIRVLLAHGADVNARNDMGITALRFAEMRDNTEAAEILRAAGAK